MFNQLFKLGKVQYYVLKTGQEIDFVLDEKLAIEAKETPVEADLSSLSRTADVAKLPRVKLVSRYQSPKFDDYAWAGSIL